MIGRLTGVLATVEPDTVVIDVAGVGYEVMVPASAAGELHSALGAQITLHTSQYFEGNPAGAHLVPRLVGFLTQAEREFFRLFTRVKGISARRALRAMCLPTAQLATAIEQGDERLLKSLPEIGQKTAGQIIAELRGKLPGLALASPASAGARPLSDAQRVAVDILVQWGDRRADAQQWVAAAVEAEPELSGPDALVRAAYRAKNRAQR